MLSWLLDFPPAVAAAIVAAIVSVATTVLSSPLRIWIERHLLRDKLSVEYLNDERKKFRSLVGKYHGRILEAGQDLNFRLWNIHHNAAKGWLRVTRYDGDAYYFNTTIYRFLNFLYYLRRYQKDAVYLDARTADEADFLFRVYVKAFFWILTDARIFENLEYDPTYATAHFLSDLLKRTCDQCGVQTDPNMFVDHIEFEKRILSNMDHRFILEFFNDLQSSKQPLRWDRLAVFHTLLLCFLNRFGYATDRSSDKQMKEILAGVRNAEVIRNVIRFSDRLGFGSDREFSRWQRCLNEAAGC